MDPFKDALPSAQIVISSPALADGEGTTVTVTAVRVALSQELPLTELT
jgi:hypothetical protein